MKEWSGFLFLGCLCLVGLTKVWNFSVTETNEIIKIGLHRFLNNFQIENNIVDQEIFKVYFDLDSKIQ